MQERLSLNAWTGREAVSGALDNPAAWALDSVVEPVKTTLAPAEEADPGAWHDSRVGWGVLMRQGAAIPAPLQKLIARRGARVWRYVPSWEYSFVLLRDEQYGCNVSINTPNWGLDKDSLPYYLLIYGTPDDIPWRVQYILNANRCVGRLDLTGDALERYISALMQDFADPQVSARNTEAVVWSVNHAPDDITALMRDGIGAALAGSLAADNELSCTFLDGAAGATAAQLAQTLTQRRPALIATTSHGHAAMYEPPATMALTLGSPVAQDHEVVSADTLNGWEPGGAIWYSHACCSAGTDANSHFGGLFRPNEPAHTLLSIVATVGSRVAPLPRALLGGERPLRAFVGHVEPTFDWTLKDPFSGNLLTRNLIQAFYQRLYRGAPIGHALRNWYAQIGGFYVRVEAEKKQFNRGADNIGTIFASQLAARDVQSLVILGDPTVSMPLLPSLAGTLTTGVRV